MTSSRSPQRFRRAFAHRHVVLPVIHVETDGQARRNAEIAKAAGADGVFLINHSIGSDLLLNIHAKVVDQFPQWWIGVNCLGLRPETIFSRISPSVAGIWVDNAMIQEGQVEQPDAESVLRAVAHNRWPGLYFGGVAFKYQRQVSDLATAAQVACRYMDVVTTSGPGTGQAAHVDKIRIMKEAMGDFPLAIASGITPGNVAGYLSHADCFLVATGISTSFTELDPKLVQALIQRVRSYESHGAEGAVAGEPQVNGSVCFVCEWNEGRSAHLELSVKHKLRLAASPVKICSAGLSQGGRISPLRGEHLASLGIPRHEIDAHRSTLFGAEHAQCSLVLVAERQMKERLLLAWPALKGRVMTIRGFVLGQSPEDESLSAREAHLEDAGGHDEQAKLALYAELDGLAEAVASRLLGLRGS